MLLAVLGSHTVSLCKISLCIIPLRSLAHELSEWQKACLKATRFLEKLELIIVQIKEQIIDYEYFESSSRSFTVISGP